MRLFAKQIALLSILMAAAAIGCTGCGQQLKWSWADQDILNLDESQWPEASGEILYERYTFYIRAYEKPVTRQMLQRVVRVNAESAIDGAASHSFWVNPDTTEMTLFRARVIQPDGSIEYLDEDDLIEDYTEVPLPDGTTTEVTLYVARFPKVKVGSIVEFIQGTEYDGRYITRDESTLTRDWPLRRYRAELWIDKKLEANLAVFNAGEAGWEKADIGKYWRYTLAVDEVAPDEDEWRDREEKLDNTWWVYQTEQQFSEPGAFPFTKDWAHQSKGTAALLFLKKPFMAEFEDEWEPPEDCKGRECVQLVWDSVNADLKVDSWGHSNMRSLKAIMEDGWATAWEKTVLLAHRLEEAGFEVRYGISNRHRRQFFDPDIYRMSSVDHLVLRLPEQDGLQEEIWLDSACEYCQLGEIPRWIDDAETLVIRKYEDMFRARMMKPRGTPIAPGEGMAIHRYELDEAGNAIYKWTAKHSRQQAIGALMDEREDLSNSDWKEELRESLERRHPDMELKDAPEATYDRANGTYTRTYTASLPGYAVKDQNELIVPLQYWRWNLDDEREHDLIFGDEVHTLINEIVPPQGWRLVEESLPEPIEVEHPAGKVTVEVEVNSDTGVVKVMRTWSYNRGEYSKGEYLKIKSALERSDRLAETALLYKK